MEEILDTPSSRVGEMRAPQEILDNGYQFSVGDSISQGFDIFKAQMGPFIGYTVVMLAINIAASFIPFASIVISAPLSAGFFIMAHHIRTGQSTEFGVFFKGFDKIGQLILFSLISGILTFIAMLFLIIPGIYLAVAYSIGTLFILFYNLEFWDAMEWSRKIVSKQWFAFFGFIIVLFFLNLAGAIALGVGMLFTFPISYCAVYAAFAQITGASSSAKAAVDSPG